MSYIAFVDMLGTRASASISNKEYTQAINTFNNTLKQCAEACQSKCTVFGYSDNAYVQVEKLTDIISFFRDLRYDLMLNHRYFSAAIDKGSLESQNVTLKDKMNSLIFTAPKVVDLYMTQSSFSGIGISLSPSIINELTAAKKEYNFCQSVFIQYPAINSEIQYKSVFDISYDDILYEELEYIFADYLITAATNQRAGRYYVTPIISMIKALDRNILHHNLKKLVSLISFNNVPNAFKMISPNDEYSVLFVFALIDFALSSREKDPTIDAISVCEQIIIEYEKSMKIIWVERLSRLPEAVMSCANKRFFLNILYNMKPKGNEI